VVALQAGPAACLCHHLCALLTPLLLLPGSVDSLPVQLWPCVTCTYPTERMFECWHNQAAMFMHLERLASNKTHCWVRPDL
jgi:hypothetical protein